MDIGMWNSTGFTFGINVCKNPTDPHIWQTDEGSKWDSVVKRCCYNMNKGVIPISAAELSLIIDKVKRL